MTLTITTEPIPLSLDTEDVVRVGKTRIIYKYSLVAGSRMRLEFDSQGMRDRLMACRTQ